MERHERLAATLDLVMDQGNVRIEELVSALDVSPATVRRDLTHLANQQLVVRTRGGASANPSSSDLPFRYRTGRNQEAAQRIAQRAVELVDVGDVVGLNGGTTTTEVAREIALRAGVTPSDAGRYQYVILTNAVNIANELAIRKNIRLVLTGGVVQPMSYELTGPLSTRLLDEVAIDILFLGVNSINLQGAFADHDGEAETNAALVRRANKVVVVAAAEKLVNTSFVKICDLDAVDVLITDESADPDAVAELSETVGEIILV